MEGVVNVNNCRILAATDPHQFLQITLHFDEKMVVGTVTCTDTGQ